MKAIEIMPYLLLDGYTFSIEELQLGCKFTNNKCWEYWEILL
jgi:hypothetical protein